MSKRAAAIACFGVAAFIAVPSTGCSFIVDHSAKQCASDDECRARGPAFTGSFCAMDGTCQRSVDYCATNTECIDRTGNSATICRKSDNRCVSLLTKQCKLFAEPDDLKNDNTVVIGSHGIPSWAPGTQACENALDMVRKDFKSTVGGLPGTPATGGKPRPVVFLSCDVPIGQQELHKAVSDHLFTEVQVPASMGPFATIEFTLYGLQQAIKSGSAMFTVSEDSPAFMIPGRQGLFFSYGFPIGGVVTGQVNGVNLLEKFIRSKGVARPLRLAYVYVSGIGEHDATLFYNQVKFNNGQTAMQNGMLYKEFNYGSTSDPNYLTNLANTAVKIKDFLPDIVVLRGAIEVTDVATAVEKSMPGIAYYLLPIEGRDGVTQFVSTSPNPSDTRKRTLGFRPGSYEQRPSIVRLNTRYDSLYDTGTSPLMRACYDMAYDALYAAGAVTTEPLNGNTLGKALTSRFSVSGTEVDATSASITQAFGALQSNQSVLVHGAEADGVWDPATGVNTEWHIQYWCVSPNLTISNRLMDLNITYAPKTDTLTGALGGTATDSVIANPTSCLSSDVN